MALLQQLESIDREILIAINGAHSPIADQIMWIASTKWAMIPVYLLLVHHLQKNFGWRNTLTVVLSTALLVGMSDIICTHFFKNVFLRYRPSHNLELKNILHFVNDYKGGTYGFISSHAANMSVIAVFVSYFLYGNVKHYFTLAFALLFLVCYSRIYLGVHYPSDILVGISVGTAVAIAGILIFSRIGFKPERKQP